MRAEIAASRDSIATLAQRYGVSPMTVLKWKHRTDFEDRPHTAHRLRTTLTPAQQAIVVALRKTLWLSLDDLLAVTRNFINPDVSRSGLDRCLRRHGVGHLKALLPQSARPAHGRFAVYEPGFVHIDVKYLPPMADETRRRYLFVAIDRATRWVFVQVKPAKTARAARSFLAALIRACPIRIRTILADNGKEFTDRFVTAGERTPSGQHAFDALCAALGIEHRLTRVRRSQTNGMVERFNGRIAEVLKTSSAARICSVPCCATPGCTTTICPKPRSTPAYPCKPWKTGIEHILTCFTKSPMIARDLTRRSGEPRRDAG